MPSRHQLVRLGDAAWHRAQAADWDAQARDCLATWAAHDWPLVVTRQRSRSKLSLGLPAPLAFGRRRIAIEVAFDTAMRFVDFPAARSIVALLATAHRLRWLELCDRLDAVECEARVYGSHGWQALTGQPYLHAHSDIDLLLPVVDTNAADAVCEVLESWPLDVPRLDGELLFPDGAGVAWREWRQWRRGSVARLLVKRIGGVALEAVFMLEGVPENGAHTQNATHAVVAAGDRTCA